MRPPLSRRLTSDRCDSTPISEQNTAGVSCRALARARRLAQDLNRIVELLAIEEEINGLAPEARRLAETVPRLEELKRFLEATLAGSFPGPPSMTLLL